MKKGIATTLVLLAISFVALLLLTKSRSFQLFGDLVNRVDTNEQVVALTFDDGPMPGYTQEILAILAQADVKATFFLVGDAIKRHPLEAQLIANAGHEIGNHSYWHYRLMFRSQAVIAKDLGDTDKQIRSLGYRGPIHFRPPYGKKLFTLPYYLASQNITTITWDLEPETYAEIGADSDAITQHIADNVKPGSIILLHVMFEQRQPTMAAVANTIAALKAQGYRFVTVDELLQLRNVSAQ